MVQKVKSRANADQKLKNSKSSEKSCSTIVLKNPIKIKFPEPMVNLRNHSPHYEAELNSSMGEISEFMPIYKPVPSRSSQKVVKNPEKYSPTPQEVEEKKELVKAQRKAKAKKLKEEKEKERKEEERRKQGLDKLNEMFRKRTQGFKKRHKEVVEQDQCHGNSIVPIPPNAPSQLLAQPHGLQIRPKTTKTSTTNSIPHSIQSPLSWPSQQPASRKSYNPKTVK